MRKFIFTLFTCVAFTVGIFSQSVPSFTTIPGTESPPVGRAYDEIKGVFEMNGFTVVSEKTGGGDQLTITKGTEWLTVRHYPDDSAAASAIASVKAAATPHTIHMDGSNLYWGTDKARHVYVHAIELDRLLAKNANHVHLLRAVQIANHTIWKYTSYDDWKNNRILNPRPKFNIRTGETVGRSYNCYEYTNIIEMLLVAMKNLQAIKDLPDADPVYTQLFHFYEQLVWDACTINLDYYKGFSVFTSTTQADVRWENIIGVPRQTKIDPLHYDVSGRQNVYDDQMWLIRCFLEAYFMLEKEAGNLTGNDLATNKERREWYLDYSEYLTAYCLDGWDQSKKPNGEEWGGILWGPGYSSKHTCSNSPLISPLVWLSEIYKDSEEEIEHLVRGGYNTNSVVPRSTLKREYYLDYAIKLYDFVYNSFKRDDDVYGDMIGGTMTVPTSGPNEGLRTTTAHGNLDQRAYSYNSGSTLSGVTDLYRVVKDPAKRKRYFDDLVALSDASFNYFADSSRKEGFYSFPQHRTGKAEFDACLLRAWVEVYIHDIHETSYYLDAFSKTLDFAYDNYFHNGFLPMDHLFGWRPEMIADNNYDNRDDVRISNLRTFNYSAQFAWISLADFFKTGLLGDRVPSSTLNKTIGNKARPNEPFRYFSLYDEFEDTGQFWIPHHTKHPERYWSCTGIIGDNSRNDISQTSGTKGLQYHLLVQSIQGLSFLATEEGRSKVAVWLDEGSNNPAYQNSREAIEAMGIREIGKRTAVELATERFTPDEDLIKTWTGSDGKPGYILTDIVNNPESGNVAAVAAHVHQAIIVDVRDQAFFDSQGYVMRYDATKKTVADSWKEFKDECSNAGLVVMPVQTGELRSYAIAHKLFVINLNHQYRSSRDGQNAALFEEVLNWLEPNAPVFGWEQGVGEDVFVRRVTKTGNRMVPYDWGYNTDFTALDYKNRQKGHVKTDHPKRYDYDTTKNYVSFYLSDGDNIQWMMNNFNRDIYYASQDIEATKFTFGLPVANLNMIAPSWLERLLELQHPRSSVFESFGGGYFYADEFALDRDREKTLQKAVQTTTAHLRQHNCKVLGLFTMDCRSADAQAAYKAYIEANNMLEGIIVIQYSPYAAGDGEVFWHKNSDGYHIPVITTKYALWNHGNNRGNQGTPAYVASKINLLDKTSFSTVCVHAWSRFTDIGDSNDPDAENASGGNVIGVAAAKNCVDRINDDTRVVNLQELIWQMRMHYYPEETKALLSRMID